MSLSQAPGQVLHRCYDIKYLHPRHGKHNSFPGIRKPIQIGSTFLRNLQYVVEREKEREKEREGERDSEIERDKEIEIERER